MSKNGHPGMSAPGVSPDEVVHKIDNGTSTGKEIREKRYKAMSFRRPTIEEPIFKYWVTLEKSNNTIDETEDENK